MVDLWGPGAFGAADAAAVRPAYPPENGAGTPDSFYQDCSSPSEDDGTEWKAAALNMMLTQMRGVPRKSGQTDSNTDDLLLARAIRSQRMNYVQAVGGTANALSLTLDPAPASWAEMLGVPLRCVIANPNTGAATGAIAGLAGTKPIVRNDNGAALEGGEIIGISTFIYDGTSLRLQAVPRLRTPRVVVPAGGVTVTAASEYTTYVMDLGVRQVFTLPAASSVPVGFSILLEVSGSPSGFQTAYVNATGGGSMYYRGGGAGAFYLIGGGEVFEFVSTGTQWLVRLVSQPSGAGVFRAAASQPATVALSTSFGDVNTDTATGTPALFQMTSSTIRVPVSGVYNVSAAMQGYNNAAAWDRLEIGIFDNTTGFAAQAVASQAVFNNFQIKPQVVFTQYYPAGTRLICAARAAGGNGLILGNASEFSVFLTGR